MASGTTHLTSVLFLGKLEEKMQQNPRAQKKILTFSCSVLFV